MANAGARGLSGPSAVQTIVSKFERPADPASEIKKALAAYGAGPVAPTPAPTGNSISSLAGSGSSSLAKALMSQIGGPVDVRALIAAAGAPTVPAASTPAAPAPTSGGGGGGSGDLTGAMPYETGGKIIGRPYQGTHSLGNWQSDHAWDISMPVGTPIIASFDGTIGSKIGSLNSKNPRMAGQRVYVDAPNGHQVYYQHLSKIIVKPGQQVKKGQVIGYSGSANGSPHLHMGSNY